MKKKYISGNSFLLDQYNKIKPNQKEQTSRLAWINFITKEIRKIYPTAQIDLFGSFYTGLYVHSSDIDLSIRIQTTNPNIILKCIKTTLSKTNLVYALLHLSHAKIPILKFKCKKYGFKFDLSINNEGGVQAAKYIIKKVESDPLVKIFAVLFKHFIYSRKLGDASIGGLNSYSQLLMIISYLDMHPLYNQNDEKNLAVLFFDFIQFYAFDFKYKNVQLDCKNKIYKTNTTKRLSIIDPTDNSIDVGACCKNFDKIVETLQNFYRLILFHFENKSIATLFEEMFYISNEELEQRRFVVSNCNNKLVVTRKKTRSTSLREMNLYKNINKFQDLNDINEIDKNEIKKNEININEIKNNEININEIKKNELSKNEIKKNEININEIDKVAINDFINTSSNKEELPTTDLKNENLLKDEKIKKTKNKDKSVNTKKTKNADTGLFDKFVDDMTSENNNIEKKIKKKQRKANKHRKNADAKKK